MAKILVKLKEASFLDLYKNQYIMADRPYVVEKSPAIESVCARGEMEVICNTLKADASDEELKKFLQKDDLKGFLAKYDENAKSAGNANANANNNQKPQNNAKK